MCYDQAFKNGIAVENMSFYLSSDDINEIRNALNKNYIGVSSYEWREDSVENSIFNTLCIYFNEGLTQLIVNGMIVSTSYETIKFAVFRIVNGVNKFIRKAAKDKPIANLRLKTEKTEIIAPIPNNLNDKQFSDYMDMLKNTLIELGTDQIPNVKRYEYFIIEYTDKQQSLSVKTITQYETERAAEQKKQREQKDES